MYQLRQAKEVDYNFVFNLFKTVYRDYIIKFWTDRDEEFKKDFHENRFKPEKIQIVLDGDKEIGILELIKKEKQLYIEEIQIDPKSQSKGVGTEIINDIKKKAFKLNWSVGLKVLKINRAKRLYERLGFRIIDETESHFIMENKRA